MEKTEGFEREVEMAVDEITRKLKWTIQKKAFALLICHQKGYTAKEVIELSEEIQKQIVIKLKEGE